MKRTILLAAVMAAAGLACLAQAETTSYLREGDHIVLIGDSITEAGHYVHMVHRALQAAYPDSGIKAVAHGSGGKTAAAGVTLLKHYLGNKPTIVCAMFAVNDTGWAAGNAEGKAAELAKHLRTFVELSKEHKFDLVFVRESHFSHNAFADPWVAGLNKVVERLFVEQDKVAEENGVPVVDVHGAYLKGLARAWQADLKYEFTPDVVHPLLPGSAAMAGELLSAFGVGLPLAQKKRGPMHLQPSENVALRVLDEVGIAPEKGMIPLAVRVSALQQVPVKGQLVCVAGSWTASADVNADGFGSSIARFEIPPGAMVERSSCEPVHVLFKVEKTVATAQSLFNQSRITNIAKTPYSPGDEALRVVRGKPGKDGPPLRDVKVAQAGDGIEVSFKWQDKTPVPAKPGFKNRFGQTVDTPLDLNSRPGGQPCDAIELLLDMRPEATAGRYTSASEGNPEGVVRIGIYKAEVEAGLEARAVVHPADLQEKLRLEPTGSDTYSLKLRERPRGYTFGFSLLVNDTDRFQNEAGTVYHLTGGVPTDPLEFMRLGRGVGGSFYRIGY